MSESVGVWTSVRKQRTKQVLRLEIKPPKEHWSLDTFSSFIYIIPLIALKALARHISYVSL